MANNLSQKAWYVATTYSSHENKVAENIRRRITSFNLEDQVFRVIVAEEKVIVKDKKDKNGNPKEKVVNLYPGYLFVEMIMTDESWYMVRNTPGVTGIIGSSGGGTKPTPVPANEMEAVLKRIGLVDQVMLSKYNVGDKVRVIDGPYKDIEGEIISLDTNTNMVTISIIFFGAVRPLEIDFSSIERI